MSSIQNSNVVQNLSIGSVCGNGYYKCGKVCVPYPCPGNISEPYINLQVVLNALEIHALQYLLEGDETTKEKRLNDILDALDPALQLVGAYAKEPSTST